MLNSKRKGGSVSCGTVDQFHEYGGSISVEYPIGRKAEQLHQEVTPGSARQLSSTSLLNQPLRSLLALTID